MRYFRLQSNATTLGRELIAGLTTFLTMAYIVVVNPTILAAAGMDQGAVFVATCLVAAFGSAVMGLLANYPVAIAPGMGLNAYFAYGVVLGMGYSWEAALGAVFISGLIFAVLSILPIREWLINAVPLALKRGIGAGIGLFLCMLGLQAAGIVVDHPQTLVTVGDLAAAPSLLMLLGLITAIVLQRRRIPGAVLAGIAVATLGAALLGLVDVPGVVSAPPSLTPTLLAMDLSGALELGLLTVIFVFLLVDFFDSAGTLIGVAQQGKLLDKDGRLPRARQALIADSSATMVGAALGTSTATSYIESASGIAAGGRTGLVALTVAGCFLLALFFAPLASAIPPFATASALLLVGLAMLGSLRDLDWDAPEESLPAALTAIAMPMTFSIATGIGIGFLCYTALAIAGGRWRSISPAVALITVLFALKFFGT